MIVDAHVHVVDPGTFPVPDGPGYKPGPRDVGTADDLRRVLARHHVSHAVVVQLSGYGTDNACILDAVARSNGRWRAIVSVPADVPERELDRLQAAGAVGVRFNVMNFGPGALAGQGRLLGALGELGWIVQVQCLARDLPALAPALSAAGGPVLFDHLGLPDPTAGLSEPGFERLLAFGRAGAFIKLSGAFRVSRESFPHADLDPFITAIREAFPPHQRVWGSDWPFTGMERKPAYDEMLGLLERWLPDPEERRMACAEVPARLYRLASPAFEAEAPRE